MRVKNNINECLFATSGTDEKKIDFTFRKSGSAALDMAYIACGRYDGYFQKNLHLWDIAAGLIIVEEAGGKLNDVSDLKINKIDIKAGNPYIYEKMVEILNKF